MQGLRDLRFDRTQVLADDERPRPMRLQREHGEHDLGVGMDVRAARRTDARRHPPQPEQARDVVDAQPVGLAEQGADEVAVGRVAGGVEPVGAPRRQPPVLAMLAERVRRGADPRAEREHVLPRPSVEALGVAADGEVVHHADADGAGCRADVAQLPLHLALQPGVVGDARRERGGRPRHRG